MVRGFDLIIAVVAQAVVPFTLAVRLLALLYLPPGPAPIDREVLQPVCFDTIRIHAGLHNAGRSMSTWPYLTVGAGGYDNILFGWHCI
jgi:hypothetical protein